MATRPRRRKITEADVIKLEEMLAIELPRFRVCYKDESALQKLISRLLWPFNRRYSTDYTTVMFGRVYFPSRAWRAQAGPERIFLTLRHEAVHLRDARRFPGVFQLSYLLLLPTVFTVRALWEMRAYNESIRAHVELNGEVPESALQVFESAFVGPDYLFMCPFRRFVRRRLLTARAKALSECSDVEFDSTDSLESAAKSEHRTRR